MVSNTCGVQICSLVTNCHTRPLKQLVSIMEGGGRLEEMSREELERRGFGPLGVDEIKHCVVRLADGCGLALRVWAPKGLLDNLGQPCPTLSTACPIVLSSGNKEIREQSTRQSWSTSPTGKLTSLHNETIADIRGWQVMVMLLFELTCGEVETPTVFTSTST